MGQRQPSSVLRQMRTLFAVGTATGLTDSELLECYTTKRAESTEAAIAAEVAFTALVDRHGAMVWGVCHRVLGNVHEAEDAFQATFLILVRKAGSVRVDGSLGRWLYGVAHRVARRARAEAQRRASGIGQAPSTSTDNPAEEVETRDLRNAMGEEVDRLPAKFRSPVELCHLQGMTYDQAARQLNWPVATVKSRLTRGRLRLRERLARRGLAPGAIAAGLATALAGEARAALSHDLLLSTARAACAGATGQFPAAVTDLTEGVLKMMMWKKLKLAAVGIAAAAGLSAQALSQQSPNSGKLVARPAQTAVQPAEKQNEKQADERPWVRSLPSGAAVEVVGVSSFPSAPDTWRRPDGTPLPAAPCDPIQVQFADNTGVPVFVVVRLSRIPDGADQHWSVTDALSTAELPARRDGKLLTDLRMAIVRVPSSTSTCTVHFKVAAGPWTTIQTWEKEPGGVGRPNGPSYLFGGAIATKKGTTISVSHNMLDKSVRIVAVDGDAKELSAEIRSACDVSGFQQIVVEFDQPPERIKEFRLETRPFEEAQIPGIVLKRN
jgi:RNA polymerase sigma factor (sigma-70 family)